MAIEDVWATHTPAKTVYFTVFRPRDGLFWNGTPEGFSAPVAGTFRPSVEHADAGGVDLSLYVHTLDFSDVHSGSAQDFALLIYEQVGGTPVLSSDPLFATLPVMIEGGRTFLSQEAVEEVVDSSGVGGTPCDPSVATLVDQDTPTTNALCYTKDGTPVDNAEIHVFLKSDYDAGLRSNEFLQGTSRTTVTGAWENAIPLDPGATYTIVFFKQQAFGPDTVEIAIDSGGVVTVLGSPLPS